MKKITRFALLAFVLFAASCGGGGGTGQGDTQQSLSGNPLIGKWYYGGPVEGTEDSMVLYCLLDFQTGGTFDTYILTGPGSSQYAAKCGTTFTAAGTKLTIASAKCEQGVSIKGGDGEYSVSGNSLTMTMNGDTLTLTKWDGNISSLQEYKSQSTAGLDNQPPEKTPTISINAFPFPHNFFLFE